MTRVVLRFELVEGFSAIVAIYDGDFEHGWQVLCTGSMAYHLDCLP